jgi:hypothetical protein
VSLAPPSNIVDVEPRDGHTNIEVLSAKMNLIAGEIGVLVG